MKNQNLNDDKKKNTEDLDFYTEDDLTVNNHDAEEYFDPNDFFSHRKKMFYWLMFGAFLLACLGAVYWFFPNATPKPKIAFFPIRVIALQSDKMVSKATVEINGKIFGKTDPFGQFVAVLRGSVDEIVSFRIVSEKADNIVEAKKKLRVKKTPNGWLPLEVRLFAAFHPRPKIATSLPSNNRCPEGMAWIAAGAFPMGSAEGDVMRFFGEKALVRTSTPGFCIDLYEAPGKGEMPIRNISWSEAKAHCATKGKRLCSEIEWERACKGSSERRFPYGNTFQPNRCNTRDAKGRNRSIRRGGSMPRCKSPFGVFDLSGNVAEWTASPFLRKGWRIIRGGSFDRPDWDVRCASRGGLPPNPGKPNVGFRCCSSPH